MAQLQTSLIWVAYAVAVGLAFVVGVITTFSWQTPRDRSAAVNAVAIVSLTAVLATALLLPVDIALVSSTVSTGLGVKKKWATPERVDAMLFDLRVIYYALYSLDALLCLLIIPFVYFWYEEHDEVAEEEGERTWVDRLRGALKYTVMFVVLVVVLFLLGFFLPAAGLDHGKHLDFDYFRDLLTLNRGEKALTFALGLLTTLGTLLYVLYTGPGLALLPITIVKSAPAVSAPRLAETTASALERNRERQRQIDLRYSARPDEPMPARDRRELEGLIREERTLVRRERIAADARGEGHSWLYRAWIKTSAVLRPVKLLGGVVLLLVALLVWVSMLLTAIDKAANSVCGAHCGFILARPRIFQPVNWILLETARFFPVDYVLVALLVVFFFAASANGIAVVGIRFLWVRVFRVRRGRTAPQALLIATVMLALIGLAVNYSLPMLAAPQYATFGTQAYCPIERPGHHDEDERLLQLCRDRPDLLKACSEVSDNPIARRVCTPTVGSTFLNRVTISWPVFGAVDFWAQFAFLALFLLVVITALFRAPRAGTDDEQQRLVDEDAEADEEEGLLSGTRRRFGATWQDIVGKTRASGRPATNENENAGEGRATYGATEE